MKSKMQLSNERHLPLKTQKSTPAKNIFSPNNLEITEFKADLDFVRV